MFRPRISKLITFLPAFALLALPVASSAQAPVAPRPGQNTHATRQAEQSWATENLRRSPRRSEWIAIRMGDRTLRGWVVYPQVRTKASVVLVMHEVFGLTDSTRNTADRIAAMGHIAITPDMASGLAPNGGGVADFPAGLQQGSIMTHLPPEYANAQFDAWANWGLKLPKANGKLAIVGLSWGGGAAFRYAAMGHHPALRAVNVFYDVGLPNQNQGFAKYDKSIPSPSAAGIDVPVYHFVPGRDTRVVNSIPATRAAMEGKRYEVITLDGADHAFFRVGEDPRDTNPANDAAIEAGYRRLRDILGTM